MELQAPVFYVEISYANGFTRLHWSTCGSGRLFLNNQYFKTPSFKYFICHVLLYMYKALALRASECVCVCVCVCVCIQHICWRLRIQSTHKSAFLFFSLKCMKCNCLWRNNLKFIMWSCMTGHVSLVSRQRGGGAAEPDWARSPASQLHPHGYELHRPNRPPSPPTSPPRARQHARCHHRPSSDRCEHDYLHVTLKSLFVICSNMESRMCYQNNLRLLQSLIKINQIFFTAFINPWSELAYHHVLLKIKI